MAASFVEKKLEMTVLMAAAAEAEAKGNRDRATDLINQAAAIEMPKKAARAAARKMEKEVKRIGKRMVKKVQPARKTRKTYAPRKASTGRSFGGHSDTAGWACETCLSVKGKIVTFRSKAAAEAHESAHRGRNPGFIALNVPAHKRMTKKCKWCNRNHSTGQHSSHGPGSFEATHPGQFPENDDD